MDAQWSDDFHHAVHAHLTGERRGYYSDYGSQQQVARALQTPFLFAWEYSPHRGRRHGAAPEGLGGDRFVVCIQNHDQVGNRAKGDRISTLLGSPAKQRLAASLMLLSPYLPLLFMGEEYGETRPFPFFCSFHGEDLIQAVREGRKREFADFLSGGETVPDPAAKETFDSAKLTWAWPEGTVHGGLRRMYRDLLAARRAWPAMQDYVNRTARLIERGGAGVVELVRGTAARGSAGQLRAYFNLTDRNEPLPAPPGRGEVVLFSSESSGYCGTRKDLAVDELLPFECVAIGPADWQSLA
jgi:maltooligosyltrehalose trehalohydrolase